MAEFVIGYKNTDFPDTTFGVTVKSVRAQTPEQAKEIFEDLHKGFKVISVSRVDFETLR